MAKSVAYLAWIWFWVISPLSLLVSCAVRYNALSSVYCLLLVTFPYSPRLKYQFIPSWLRYTRTVLAISFAFICAHIAFQVVLASNGSYGSLLSSPKCSNLELTMSYVGLHRFDGMSGLNVFRLVAPEIIVFIVGVITYGLIKKAKVALKSEEEKNGNKVLQGSALKRKIAFETMKNYILITISIVLMAVAGIALPSALSSFYVVSCFLLCLLWGFNVSLLTWAVTIFRAFTSAISALHLLFFHMYQIKYFQDRPNLDPGDIFPRIIGLRVIVEQPCSSELRFPLQAKSDVDSNVFVSLVLILILHWSLAIGVRVFFRDYLVFLTMYGYTPKTIPLKEKNDAKPTTMDEQRLLANELEDGADAENGDVTSTRLTEKEKLKRQKKIEKAKRDEEAARKRQAAEEGLIIGFYNWFEEARSYSLYPISLFAMVVWSVAYISWNTFTLMMLSFILWYCHNSGRWTLLLSPIFTIYGMLMVLMEYVYAFDLTEDELPTNIKMSGQILKLSEFGIERGETTFGDLLLKMFFVLTFVIVMSQRKAVNKKIKAAQNGEKSEMKEASESKIYQAMCKYWIIVVTANHMFMAFSGRPSGIKIVYMFLLFIFIHTFVTMWPVWKKILKVYLMVTEVFTIAALIAVYTFQFENIPPLWKNATGFNDAQLRDFGLYQEKRQYELAALMMPHTIFLLCSMVQLHYVNEEFLRLIRDPTPEAIANAAKAKAAAKHKVKDPKHHRSAMGHARDILYEAQHKVSRRMVYLHRFLLFHLEKIVYITVMWAAISTANAQRGILLIVWILLLPYKKLHWVLGTLTCLYISVSLIVNMFMQLSFVTFHDSLNIECNIEDYSGPRKGSNVLDQMKWLGFQRMEGDQFIIHVQGLVSIVVMIMFERAVGRREAYLNLLNNTPSYVVTSIFPIINWRHADINLTCAVKYYINFFFYNFGLEVCYVTTLLTILATQDLFSIFYGIMFWISFGMRKKTTALRKYFHFQIVVLTLMYIWIYLSSIGMPPFLCPKVNYPWIKLGTTKEQHTRLLVWLNLPEFFVDSSRSLHILEFFQIFFLVMQQNSWRMKHLLKDYGGDNAVLIGSRLDEVTVATNPTENFVIIRHKNSLHKIKIFIFEYFSWLTLVIVFWTGTTQISLYCLGYLVGFFYMIFKQQKVIMGSVRVLIRTWYFMILYSTFVIFAKNVMQLGPCVFRDDLNCHAREVFIMFCSYSERYKYATDDDSCGFTNSSSGLGWDITCFIFLMIQLRIFSSYEFLHVREDMITSVNIAHLGYEMYNNLIESDAKQRVSEESACIEEIKHTMSRLKASNAGLYVATKPGHYDVIRGDNSSMFSELNPVSAESKSEDKPESEKASDVLESGKGQEGPNVRFSSFSSQDPTTVGTDSHRDHLKRLLALRAAEIENGEDPTDDPDLDSSSAESTPTPHEDSKAKVICLKIYTILKSIFLSLLGCLSGIMKWVALKLNLWCYKYRNILRKLEIQKAIISREAAGAAPDADARERLMQSDVDNASDGSLPDPSKGPPPGASLHHFEELEGFDQTKHPVVQFINALWFFYIIKGDLICYILIIANLTMTASLLSMVLPLAVFFWATFASPRPTKKFWTFVMLYLELVICIRFVFQFNFFYWNDHTDPSIAHERKTNPYWFPYFIGIDKWKNWMVMDLLQLFTVVFHVNVIKQMGLWEVRGFSDNAIEEVLRKTMCDQPSEQQMLAEADETGSMKPGSALDIQRNPFSQLTREHNDLPLIGRIILKMKLTASLTKREGITPSFSQRAIHTLMLPVMFYWEVLHQRITLVTDVYVYMVTVDIINTIIVVFGFGAFGEYANVKTDVMKNMLANRVPTGFLMLLLFQFFMIFLDRALYLKKNLAGRLYFHIVLMCFVHGWLFFLLPGTNGSPFFVNRIAQTWYSLKCIYFLLSAYQIRVGYPLIVNINFITKHHSLKGLIAFKIYKAIPFIPELGSIMNWMFTTTTLDLTHWMCLWTIEHSIFEIKCWRTMAKKAPVPRGRIFPQKNKYIVGGILVTFAISVCWFPLLSMNIILNIVGIPNNPTGMDIQVGMDTFEQLMTAVTDNASITEYTEEDYNKVIAQYPDDARARKFLNEFDSTQLTDINMITESQSLWTISPPQKMLLIDRLSQIPITTPLQIYFRWNVKRSDPRDGGIQYATGETSAYFTQENMDSMKVIVQASIAGTGLKDPGNKNIITFGSQTQATTLEIADMMPKFLHLTATSAAVIPVDLGLPAIELKALSLSLKGHLSTTDEVESMWWELAGAKGENMMVCYSDKVSPKMLQPIVDYGVVGLYLGVVLVVGNIFRNLYAGLFRKIQLGQLQQVEKLHQLLNDISLVRELGEMNLEEDLFGKLVYAYRSPETLLKFTKKNL